MARDGFLPPALARVSKRGTPARVTIVTALFVAVIAALMPIARSRAGFLVSSAAVEIASNP
ncbi:MAG: amino acid permease, partial [Sphingomonas sp.]